MLSKKRVLFLLFATWLYKEYKHRKRYLQMETDINNKKIKQDPFQIRQMIEFVKTDVCYQTLKNCFGGVEPEKLSDEQMSAVFTTFLPDNPSGVEQILGTIRTWLKPPEQSTVIKPLYGPDFSTQPCKFYLPWCFDMVLESFECMGSFYLRYYGMKFGYRNRIPFWYRIVDDSTPVVFFHGLTGSTLMVHDTVRATPHKNIIIPMYPPITVGFDRKDSHLIELDEYWDEIDSFLLEHKFGEIDIIAWSYGGYTSSGFLTKKHVKVRRQILMEPAGNPYTCSLAIWLMCEPVRKTYQILSEESKYKQKGLTLMIALILHTYKSARCCKYNLPFRHCEWGENWNNKNTLILLSKDDPLMSVEKVKPFYDKYVPDAKILIRDGVHGSWMCNAKVDRCIKEWFSFGIEFTFD